jgi:hypothetical protein
MPLSSIVFERSPALKDKVGSTGQVPDYAVLFFYGKLSAWVNTSSGTLNHDYYSSLTNKTNNFQLAGATPSPIVNWPIVGCAADYSTAITSSGYLNQTVDTGLFNYGTLLDVAGAHNPTTVNFRSAGVPLAFAFNTGDVSSTVASDTYIAQTGPHYGHQHYTEGSDLIKALNNMTNASGSVPTESFGLPQLAVEAVVKDPTILNKSTVLGWLPKNVIVFGQDLPANSVTGDQLYYSRTDTFQTGSLSFNNHPTRGNDNLSNSYYITCYSAPYGTFFNPTSNVVITSNTYPDHTHNVVPVVNSKKSTKTGQKASIETAAGAHNHPVTYNLTSYLPTKKLKAWLTQNDKTPIANGVIIGYAPATFLGFNYQDPTASVQSLLPAGWFVCDGNNGTPDLRNFYIGANFNDSDHDVDITNYSNAGNMLINSINVTANGAHSHVSAGNLNIVGPTGTPKDIGSHLLEPSTTHTHNIATNASFKNSSGTLRNNLTVGFLFAFQPATFGMNFIMYNENLVSPGYDVNTTPPDISSGDNSGGGGWLPWA